MRFLKIILVALLACIQDYAYGQYSDKGILLGISGSQITGIQYNATGWGGYYKLGLDAGVFLKRHLDRNWSISGELKYIQKGAANNFSTSYTDYWRINLRYIELPVYFSRRISPDIEGEFGIAWAYLLSANTYSLTTGSQPFTTGSRDLSAILGVSYKVTDKLNIDLKLSYSAVPFDYQASYVTWQGSMGRYNNVLELALYYKLN